MTVPTVPVSLPCRRWSSAPTWRAPKLAVVATGSTRKAPTWFLQVEPRLNPLLLAFEGKALQCSYLWDIDTGWGADSRSWSCLTQSY